MAFRFDEAADATNEEARRFLAPVNFPADVRRRSLSYLDEVIAAHGPAVSAYPTWHPLVSNHLPRSVVTLPGDRCGYSGLDHTRYFRTAFITCPYGNGQDVFDSITRLQAKSTGFWISAERVDVPLYSESATPILISVDLGVEPAADETIPKSLAVPLMMMRELADWPGSQVGETWETMRAYFLGSPHGARSSLFVNQDTALAMKRVHEAMNASGMFGPVHPSR